MSKIFDDVIAEVRRLPDEEQDAAAGVLLTYLGTRQDIQLTDEQVAEVRRRRADPNRRTVSVEEAFRRLVRE
jgi:Arc/MetJ family transcription regulator